MAWPPFRGGTDASTSFATTKSAKDRMHSLPQSRTTNRPVVERRSGAEFVHGLTTDGVIFPFAQNNVDLRTTPVNGFNSDFRGSEFAGACYSPDGKWLFFNIQSPGISFAVTGPWGSGGI